MAEGIIKDVKLVLDGRDLSGRMNQFNINYSADMLDRTVFGSSFKKRKAGLKTVEISGAAFFDSVANASGGGNDPVIFPKVGAGGSTSIVTVCPSGFAVKGYETYFSKGVISQYSPAGQIGELLGLNIVIGGDGELIRGKVMESATNLSTGNIGNINLFSERLKKSQKIYGAIHVFKVSTGRTYNLDAVRCATTNFDSPTSAPPAKTTQFTITISTADMGKAKWGSTKISSSSTGYSYRFQAKNVGSTVTPISGSYFLATLGHK